MYFGQDGGDAEEAHEPHDRERHEVLAVDGAERGGGREAE
jgi:hypothetical protein